MLTKDECLESIKKNKSDNLVENMRFKLVIVADSKLDKLIHPLYFYNCFEFKKFVSIYF